MASDTVDSLPKTVNSTVNYVARRDEPIYSYEFMEPPPGRAATNRIPQPHPVVITNLRDLAQPPTLDREGFMVVPFTTQVVDIYDLAQVESVYIPEVAQFLKQLLGAREVVVYMPFLRGPESAASCAWLHHRPGRLCPCGLCRRDRPSVF